MKRHVKPLLIQLPVGTGPYKVVEFKPGDTAVYEPNSFFQKRIN
jgi:ABC-type transport system substrate-binding protein